MALPKVLLLYVAGLSAAGCAKTLLHQAALIAEEGTATAVIVVAADAPEPEQHAAAELPFDRGCPIFYDNDDHRDVYTDEYLLALAHLGDIELKGMMTTYRANQREYNLFVAGRQEICDIARASGMKNVPKAMAGASTQLQRPASNRIEDTKPLDLPSSRWLARIAARATEQKPLVIVTGGQLTAIADAYLLDPSIAPKVVVSGVFGCERPDYNSGLDRWAWTIVMSKFRVLSIPFGPPGNRGTVYRKMPLVPRRRIREQLGLKVPFFKMMHTKQHPRGPHEADADGQGAVVIMRPDYITKTKRFRATGIDATGNPVLVADEGGPIYKAVDADQQIATGEFWRAMKRLASSLRHAAGKQHR
jgi:hypothetical protein